MPVPPLSEQRRIDAKLDALTARLQGATRQPLARTIQSLAFGLLREGAAVDGAPTPRRLSGPEQEAVIAELLAGHDAEGTGPRWPASLGQARTTKAFRRELRDLLMRAVEHDVDQHHRGEEHRGDEQREGKGSVHEGRLSQGRPHRAVTGSRQVDDR